MSDRRPSRRYRSNLQGEVDSAALYRALAEAETNPQLKEVYGRLAAVEEAHAQFWRERLDRARRDGRPRAASAGARARSPGSRGASGRDSCCRSSTRSSAATSTQYDAQPEAVAAGLPAAERSHARIIEAAERPVRGGFRAARSPGSRAGTARSAAMRCARPCSAPMTGSSPI